MLFCSFSLCSFALVAPSKISKGVSCYSKEQQEGFAPITLFKRARGDGSDSLFMKSDSLFIRVIHFKFFPFAMFLPFLCPKQKSKIENRSFKKYKKRNLHFSKSELLIIFFALKKRVIHTISKEQIPNPRLYFTVMLF